MDPVTALSVTCNALQLFGIAWNVLSGARDIHGSVDGTTTGTKTLDAIAEDVARLSCSFAAQSSLPNELQELNRLSKIAASDLSDVLSSLKTKSPNSKFQSFRVALKEVWARGQIKEFTDRIQLLQARVMSNIQFLMMNEQSEVYSQVMTLEQTTRDLGARFQENLDQLREDVVSQLSQMRKSDVEAKMDGVLNDVSQLTLEQPIGLEAISIKLDELTGSISQLQQDMKVTKSHQDTLQAIRFEGLKFRYDRIPRAYNETFDWAFADDVTGVHGKVSLRFRDWLEDQNGIFWIRGKAGSGKSTLMKYLCNDSRTFTNLQTWAGRGQKLVIAKYFFWNPGMPLQKSQEGLIRSLLFDILRQCPEHIARVDRRLARRRAEVKDDEEFWTWDMLWGTLNEVVSENKTAKICFFIDGLDEFVGDGEIIIDTISALASYSAVKVCVSSRPWAEFVQAFGIDEVRLLRVEDLTAKDIRRYVYGSLFANGRFKGLADKDASMSQLLDEIVSKSDGVFLWVHLVVRSLLQGLKFADSKQFLWKRLRSFPPDLNDFFLHMLKGIPDIYRAKASGTFKTAMISSSPLPAIVYYFIDCVEEDDNFALDSDWCVMPPDETASNIEDTALRLDGWTKGLLEVVHNEGKPDYVSSTVEFLHRTVRDFIEESDYVRELFGRAHHPQLDASGMICHGSLAFLKRHPKQDSAHINYDFVMNVFNHASMIADDNWRIKRIHPVLDEVGKAMMEGNRTWKYTASTGTICEYAAEYGLKDYIKELLQSWDPTNADFGGQSCLMEDFYTDLLWISLRSRRTSTRHDRPWAAISMTVTYLVEMGADPNQHREGETIWRQFLNDFGDRIRGSTTIYELLCKLVAAGADLDAPFNNSVFRKEIRLTLPQDQAAQLLTLEPKSLTSRQ